MLAFLRKIRLEREPRKEEAFTIIEIMVAAVIVAMVLTFSAVVIASGVKTTAMFEARSKAQNLASSVISIAQQAPYRQLWVARSFTPDAAHPESSFISATNEQGKCSPSSVAPPTYGVWATTGETGFYQRPDVYAPGGLTYCTSAQFGTAGGSAVGTTYFTQTDVSYVTDPNAAYDTSEIGATGTNFDTGLAPAVDYNLTDEVIMNTYQPQMYYAKRVTVTVRWYDISNSGKIGEAGYNEVSISYTAVPDPSECVPGTFNIVGTKVVWQGTTRTTGLPDDTGTPTVDESIARSFEAPPGCAP